MTYDPYRDLPRANPPRPSSVDRAAAMGWTFTAIASAVTVAGIALYNTGPVRTPTAANPPGAQAPAPVPDETVGTSAPSIALQPLLALITGVLSGAGPPSRVRPVPTSAASTS